MMTASGGVGVEVMACEMEDWFRGEPAMIPRPGVGVREEGLRASAVMVWFRESKSWRMRVPVRPVAPRRRMCIFGVW